MTPPILLLAATLAATLATAPPPAAPRGGGEPDGEEVGPRVAAGPDGPAEDAPRRVRRIEVRTRDVYSEPEAAESFFYRAVNALHATTRDATVRRELWFGEGDLVTAADASELERNLRATGLYAAVDVELRDAEEPGTCDVVVTTRDRLSIVFGAAGALVGGVGSVSATVGETNLLGRGDRAVVDFRRNDEGEESLGLFLTDRHFLDRRLRLGASLGETDEGPFYSLRLTRRFLHLEDPWSWTVAGAHAEDEADFFASGETVAEVPRRTDRLDAAVEHAWGPRDERHVLGLDLAHLDVAYEPAVGPGAAAIDVPGDTRRTSLGPFYRFERVTARRQVENLDTLDFVQDLELGYRPEVLVAAVLRDEDGQGQRVEPLLSASLRGAVEAGAATYLTARTSGSVRLYAGEAQGWSAHAALHAFHFASARHTLAASLAYDAVFEGEDLPRQLTLGEDNGLRGYPAREFAGDRRLRFNLEDRIETGLEVRSVHVDLVAFADAGWIDGEPSSPDELLTSAGLGLRLGSSELFGAGVLRVDVAFPLTDVAGTDDVSISIAFGQVFTFFGNASEL